MKIFSSRSLLLVASVAMLSTARAATVNTIEVFVDFKCPFSHRYFSTLRDLQNKYGDKVEISLKDFPLEFHQGADLLAKAHICAADPSELGEYHAFLFDIGTQPEISIDQLAAKFASLGGSELKFRNCLNSESTALQLKENIATAERREVNSTPTSFINDKKAGGGALSIEDIEKLMDFGVKN